MSVVILISGEPGSGKSTLAQKLKAEHDFEILHLDGEYVQFIKTHCPAIYFELLPYYIKGHYKCVMEDRDCSLQHCQRDFIREWHQYLRNVICDASRHHMKLAVEGWLLHDFKDEFQASPPPGVQVYSVKVSQNHRYALNGTAVTVEQIAALGAGPRVAELSIETNGPLGKRQDVTTRRDIEALWAYVSREEKNP